MQAVFIENQQLVMRECAQPQPGAAEVLIKVAYAGLNRADIFQREGSYPGRQGAPNIPGLEVSGSIEQVGPDAGCWQEGETVCALLEGGGYSEYVIAKAAHCLPVAQSLSLKEAAALPECAVTLQMALWDEARLAAGESVLIHGGASGIGTTGIQMLRAAGHEVFVTAGDDKKITQCKQLGAHAIHYHEADFVSVIKEAGGVDVILDMVGGDYIDRSLQCLKVGGRLVSIAFLRGSKPQISAGRLLMKRLHWIGATLRSRSDAQKAAYIQALQKRVWPQLVQGQIRPVIDSVFPLSDAASAQEKMQKYLHCGKILLEVQSD